jgi:hypothetical protein
VKDFLFFFLGHRVFAFGQGFLERLLSTLATLAGEYFL